MSQFTSEMTDTERKAQKKKDLIKNIAIAFLTVLLLLTFLSNTFMNYTLPQVATQMVQPGQISPKIRGTGTVEADDPYNVMIGETRKIASVAVKVGDTVKKDDVIYYLEDKKSKELEEAQTTLNDMETAYEKTMFSGDLSDAVITRLRKGQKDSLDGYQARLRNLQSQFEAAERADKNVKQAQDILATNQAWTDAERAYNSKTYEYSSAQNTYEKTKLDAEIASVQAKITEAEKSLGTDPKTMVDTAESALGEAKEAQKIIASRPDATETEKQQAQEAVENASKALEDAKKIRDETQDDYDKRKKDLDKMKDELQKKVARSSELSAALAENTRNTAQLNTETAQVDQHFASQKAGLDYQKVLTDSQLADATKEKEQKLKELLTEIDLVSQLVKITEQRTKVKELTEKAVGATITAPVEGKISSLSLKAGESTAAENAVAVIQVTGKAVTTSFSVTNEQASKLKVGDAAAPQNAWYYSQFKATLTAIKPDTSDPAGKKKLVFTIDSPEVQVGETVNLEIGESAKTYDLCVPNTAIREDNNGKFVLVINSKSSPLGNRYAAKRVDVQVQASDDKISAVAADLNGSEYVITTTTQPVKAGDQVRLSNENT